MNSGDDETALQQPSWGLWLIVCVLFVTILAIAAAHLPARVRLVGIFSILHGALAGFGLARIAQSLEIPASRNIFLVVILLIAAGLIGSLAESHRLYRDRIGAQHGSLPNPLDLALKSSNPEFESDSDRREYEEIRRNFERAEQERSDDLERRRSFSGYLAFRVSAFGTWPIPWPDVFAGLELILAALAGAILFHRMVPDVERHARQPLS